MELENVSPGEAVLIFAIVSALVALLGRNREIGYGRSLVCCFFGTPILGLIIVLCSEKNSTREERLREERVAERARDFVMKKIDWEVFANIDFRDRLEIVREMMALHPKNMSLSDLRKLRPHVILGSPEWMIFDINYSYWRYLKKGKGEDDYIMAIVKGEGRGLFKHPLIALNFHVQCQLEKEYPQDAHLYTFDLSYRFHLFIKDKIEWRF